MKLKEIYELIDRFAPFELTDMYRKDTGFVDNSGIIIGTDADITNVVFALDLTEKAIEYAQWVKAGLIVTHHPAIFTGIKSIDGVLLKAAASGIGVISCHINFDAAEKGVDYFFAKGIANPDDKDIEILHPLLTGTGYGRRYPVELSLDELAQNIEREFNTKVHVYGDKTAYIKNCASFCGAGLDTDSFKHEADVYISADLRHHVLVEAIKQNKKVIAMTHFSSENYGLKLICKHFSNIYRLKNKLDFYFFDDDRFI
ncbi:MAG: Nif3-like dinuclear metal center hexameric protein [Clostridia bacterium]|nr:Nif3-like dinuclear metal center hexameric protein [Clostridia bacterium]MBQ3495542.1 Nif3-like dinuclear metal center hexameric protein [Clostridia bacterium]MBQ4587085.1 Nif3-like dinuclear metal center hexameric protein [Clostridia bacterium]MBQ6883309.1 Nif3-like dinuclear metal center hexameric protein [Clostridia bacterium]